MTPDKTPTEAELLPCPFCGEAAKHSFNSLYGDMSMASCKSCGATAYAPKWNRRAVLAKWGKPAPVGAEPVAWWIPIEKAPKDGTEFLAVYGRQGNVKQLARWNSLYGHWESKGNWLPGFESNVTAIYLLPASPTIEGESK